MEPADWLTRLKSAYRTHAGIGTVSGLNPYHFANARDVAFTHYFSDGQSLTNHLGVSVWELLMLERACRALSPRSIFVIGNGLGWSAIALALMNPHAFVVAVEPDSGIELTNRIAFHERLSCRVVQGFSPGDNARIIRDWCPSPPDLVLVDGVHDDDHVVLDFNATFQETGPGATFFFHDIANFNLFRGLSEIRRQAGAHGMRTALLMGTPSGMAVVAPEAAPAPFWEAIDLFRVGAGELDAIGRAAGAPVPAEWLEASA